MTRTETITGGNLVLPPDEEARDPDDQDHQMDAISGWVGHVHRLGAPCAWR